MLHYLRDFRRRWLDYKHEDKIYRTLDTILLSLGENKNMEDQLFWLVRLLRWVRHSSGSGESPVTRIKFFLMILDRHPQHKETVAKTLRNILRNTSALELFTETGLPKELGLWGELADRLILKVLPVPPLEHNLSALFWALFPDENDAVWLSSIDAETFSRLVQLFNYKAEERESAWNRIDEDIQNALKFLIIQVRALGLSPAIRHRLDNSQFTASAFYRLGETFDSFLLATQNQPFATVAERSIELRSTIQQCRDELQQVQKHLDEFGVSLNLVFQMMRLRIYLQRMESLLDIWLAQSIDHHTVTLFLANVVEDNQELRSIQSLLSQNIALMARKIVERAAETGEHYITRNKAEYMAMLKAAAGGGALTSLTVFGKIGILSLGLSGFMEGFLVSLLYALTFVAIQLFGFTLGTKQPAMTAPALAEKMQDVDSKEGMNSLTTEIMLLIRSQVASVLGNVLLVAPCAFLIDWLFFSASGTHLIPLAKAHGAASSAALLGPSLFYGAFTGILLWVSSIAAGWGDNWFALHSLRKTLARSPSLIALFGKRGARSIALFLQKNLSGLVGNISLGFMLGMIPVFMTFMSLPLDIRHVTISSGTLGAALPSLGTSFLTTWPFWNAVLGCISIGMANVTISFGLALLVALKARSIRPPQRAAIRRAIRERFWKEPLGFFLPLSRDDQSETPSEAKEKSHPSA